MTAKTNPTADSPITTIARFRIVLCSSSTFFVIVASHNKHNVPVTRIEALLDVHFEYPHMAAY